MKLLNIDEEIPEVFYIFIGQGKNLPCQINYHNYKLSSIIVSSGINSVLAQSDMIQNFINGDINYAPYVPSTTTLYVPSSHMMSVVNGYTVEYALERWRNNNFKTLPSRFSCIYAFGDWDSCVLASKYYGWDLSNVKKFRIQYFSEDNPKFKILNKAIKVCKCNMEIVTYLWNNNIQSITMETSNKICQQYWCGGKEVAIERQNIETGNYEITNSRLLYEYLIEGILEEIKEQ